MPRSSKVRYTRHSVPRSYSGCSCSAKLPAVAFLLFFFLRRLGRGEIGGVDGGAELLLEAAAVLALEEFPPLADARLRHPTAERGRDFKEPLMDAYRH